MNKNKKNKEKTLLVQIPENLADDETIEYLGFGLRELFLNSISKETPPPEKNNLKQVRLKLEGKNLEYYQELESEFSSKRALIRTALRIAKACPNTRYKIH